MRGLAITAALTVAAMPAALSGQGESPLPFDLAHHDASELGVTAPNAVPDRIRYGEKGWQEIFFYGTKGAKPAALVIALGPVDARGWPRYRINQAGLAFAAIPNVEREPDFARKALANYSAAIAKLYDSADALGIDRTRIVLVGSGFGAGIAALFGTDPTELGKAGIPFESLRGVVAIDGDNFDLARRSAESAIMRAEYKRVYAADPTALAAFSPMAHIASPNAPAFLLLSAPDRTDAVRESGLMTSALVQGGTEATFVTLPEPRKGNLKTLFLAEQGGSGWQLIDFLQHTLGMR
jgi:hypothetical protein